MFDRSAAGVAIRRFFIVGCQRTGTTLLRLVLECHPEIACLDETNSYRSLSNLKATVPRSKTLLGFKIPRWTEQLHEATLGDFGQTETAAQFYDGEPLIFLLRDVRDTVVSMCQLRMGRQTWMDVAGRPILDSKLRQPEFRERFAREIALLERSTNPTPPSARCIGKTRR